MKPILSWVLILSSIGCSGPLQPNPDPPSMVQSVDETEQNRVSVSDYKTIDNRVNNDLPKKGKNQEKIISKQKIILDVPIIEQNPELKNGCEVTSLAMVLQYAGMKVGKMELAKQVPKDNDPVSKNSKGDITHWGNPAHGFVGDITGKNMGYAIFAKPLEKLMDRYLPNRTVNLTGKSFDTLLNQVQSKKPVLVWTTGDFKSPDRWESWTHGKEKIKTPLDLHVVVLTGFDSNYVYVNDPLTGRKNQKVDKQSFIRSWNELGKQALSYK
ncbi:C39 family peptidase [Ammoniphilus resinae]|uniref:Uncharacterized protein YvpB n=1 Tax=Ammoniphilus resinae TaxID=861532 RepID=A0ABS4GIL5_9BACL|nr:C39 family peptidase [Ammoniphilus resinae]MBP1930091.1 uncharacterized protein YvpB [Ammoniphilus resinae]